MNKLTILLFSILISFNSYGEWVEITKDNQGNTLYINKDTIKEDNGYIYYWEMIDLVTPDSTNRYMSYQMYNQGECVPRRYKDLATFWYTQSMATGEGIRDDYSRDSWWYPTPGSNGSKVHDYACNYVK